MPSYMTKNVRCKLTDEELWLSNIPIPLQKFSEKDQINFHQIRTDHKGVNHLGL